MVFEIYKRLFNYHIYMMMYDLFIIYGTPVMAVLNI